MQRFLFRLSTLCLLCVLPASAQFGIFKPAKPSTTPTPNDPMAGHMSKQPDKELFDKAVIAMKKGKFDVARLDLQTLLNTYPESEYQMRAKLLVGDAWFKEGGTAALTQAEAEYKDFITFFPNTPEAAEAQMKVADIYYMQMEKPDRDPKNAEQAEREYRTMIQQFPDSTFVPRAKQRLREVQEVLAERQYQIGSFYATHENWAASIARLQTVTDAYPLYSHSDLALIGLGDAYAAEARFVQNDPRMAKINPKAKQELMKAYDDQAADAYARVITHYSMAAHVEDARERLIALNRSVPEPTKEELADSEAEEQSRTGITFKDRALLLIKRGPVTVNAARVGEPTLVDPPEVTAPAVHKRDTALFVAAITDKPLPVAPPVGTAPAAVANGAADSAPDANTPLQLENVPGADAGAPAGSGPGIGAQIVSTGQGTPGDNGAAPATSAPPREAAPADPGAAIAAEAAGVPGAENPGGLKAVGPANNQPLPPIEKPAEAAAQINDVHNAAQVQTGTDAGATTPNGKAKKKTPAPKYDSSDESSSKHKKKKGLDKLNPF